MAKKPTVRLEHGVHPMQFSIAKLLLVTLFVNFVVAATFALPPLLGTVALTFAALFIIPPFIIVGVINTRGLRQSFFLGAMVSGSAHYILNIYYAVMLAMTVLDSGVSVSDFSDDGLRYVNAFGFLLGASGGVCGMAAYLFLKLGNGKNSITHPNPLEFDEDDDNRPAVYPESKANGPSRKTFVPR